jgi:DNA primase
MQPGDGKSRVLAAVDIVQLVSRTVALKKRGKNFLGLCPFHQEKTPSFNVLPDRQIFYCFGCKKTGNAIDFVMERDRLEFFDALKQLADELRIELPRGSGNKEQAGERQRLLDAQSAGVGFFRRIFTADSRGQTARQYMEGRGFDAQTLDAFKVGYAPNAWDSVSSSPEFKSFEPNLLQLAGLLKVRESGDGSYDTFRDRVMFPIRDETGKTIAFGGRVLPGSDNPAKYLNSPETPIFSKSKCAFGLDMARQRIVETRTAVIVEGYTDVMMAHQYDVKNVVSILGTAMTESHVGLLRRFADKIVLLFDADTAGEGAAERSLELFLTQPVEIGIATLPAGKDPDEVLLNSGKPGMEQIIADAVPALDFLWKKLRRELMASENDLTGRQRAIDAFLAMMAKAQGHSDRLRWNAALVRVGHLTEIRTEELTRRIRTVHTAKPAPGTRAPTSKRAVKAAILGARERAERTLLGALLCEPSHWNDVQKSIHSESFTEPALRALAIVLWDHYRNEGVIPLNEFLDLLAGDLKSLALELAADAPKSDFLSHRIAESVEYIRSERQRDEEVGQHRQRRRRAPPPARAGQAGGPASVGRVAGR